MKMITLTNEWIFLLALLLYLINDPWAVKVSVLRGLPPADASRCCAGPEWDLQGHQSGLIAAVAEEKFLEEAPAETPVH